KHPKASDLLAIYFFYFGNKTEIMQIAQCRILVTGRKGNLELPAHLLVDRISEQVPKGSLSIRRHIKGLIGINARHLGRGDVSYSIAASFPNGDIILVQFCPQLRGA